MDKRIDPVVHAARQPASGVGALAQGDVAALADLPVGIHARATVPSVPPQARETEARDPGLLVQRCRT